MPFSSLKIDEVRYGMLSVSFCLLLCNHVYTWCLPHWSIERQKWTSAFFLNLPLSMGQEGKFCVSQTLLGVLPRGTPEFVYPISSTPECVYPVAWTPLFVYPIGATPECVYLIASTPEFVYPIGATPEFVYPFYTEFEFCPQGKWDKMMKGIQTWGLHQ